MVNIWFSTNDQDCLDSRSEKEIFEKHIIIVLNVRYYLRLLIIPVNLNYITILVTFFIFQDWI